MDALLMCGGRGTRLDASVEKPLLEVGGRPMVERVADALAASRAETTYAVVSPHAPETRAFLARSDDGAGDTGDALPTIVAPGAGYVEDLDRALGQVGTPVLSVAADLPLLVGEVVDAVLDAHADARSGRDAESLAVCVPAALKRRLGASVDETWTVDGREVSPAGLNVVGEEPDSIHLSYDARLAVNVNRPADVEVAEALL